MSAWAVTGTRSALKLADHEIIVHVLVHGGLSFYPGDEFHHGDADGVDRYSASVVREWLLEPIPHVADWKRYGKKAGPIRNREMLDSAKIETLFAFPRRGIPNYGTLDCVRAATEREIDLVVTWLEA